MALFAPISPEPQQHFMKGMQNVDEMEKMQLANALSRINNQYQPGLHQSEIELKKGQAFENRGRGTNYFAEASTAPSKIKLNEASAGHMNALTALAPQELALKAKALQQQNSRFGGAYQMARILNAMPAPARAQWIAQNQHAYSQILSELGNQIPQGNAPANALNVPTGPSGQPQQNALTQPPGRFGTPTPEQTAQLAKANELYANKALTTASTGRQLEGAIQVENIINSPQVQSQVMNAAKYAGAARKGKAAIDALSQQNPAAYEDYIAFQNQTMVLLQNRIKTLDQMGATDKQREELMGLYGKTMDSLTSNPKQFITQFNKLGQALDTVAQSVQKSATPLASINRLTGFNPLPEESTQDLSSMSLEQLQQIAGGG